MVDVARFGPGPRPTDQRDAGDLYERVRRCLGAEIALFGSSAPQARIVRLPGVVASISPETPERSLFNSVMYESPAALGRAYEEVALAYHEAGVRAFTVWVDPGDTEAAALLEAQGHVLDSKPIAMANEIARLQLPDTQGLDWQETRDMSLIAALNDTVWQTTGPAYAVAFQRLDDPRWRGYAARVDGKPVCCLLVWDGDYGDAGVSAVATLPEARGQGLASKLLAQVLNDAVARGCSTSSLQSSPKGQSTYLRLGYRTLGEMEMWERRTAV